MTKQEKNQLIQKIETLYTAMKSEITFYENAIKVHFWNGQGRAQIVLECLHSDTAIVTTDIAEAAWHLTSRANS